MLVLNNFKPVNVNSEDVPLTLLKHIKEKLWNKVSLKNQGTDKHKQKRIQKEHRRKTGGVNTWDEKRARRQPSPVRQTRRSEVFDFKGRSVKNSTAEQSHENIWQSVSNRHTQGCPHVFTCPQTEIVGTFDPHKDRGERAHPHRSEWRCHTSGIVERIVTACPAAWRLGKRQGKTTVFNLLCTI